MPSPERGGGMRRWEFLGVLSGAAATWPIGARAQSPMPAIGFLNPASPETYALNIPGVCKVLELRSEYGVPKKVLTDPMRYYDPGYYEAAIR